MAIRKLTTSQQVRLTQYLDDELLTVERDVNKRLVLTLPHVYTISLADDKLRLRTGQIRIPRFLL